MIRSDHSENPSLFPLTGAAGEPLRADRVLIIGLDGATWSILGPALEGGYMPRLAHLGSTGCSGVLTSVVPAITPAAWCSFQTGSDPGRTGIVDFTRFDRAAGCEVPVDTRRLPETLWERVGRAGRRVGVVNLPMTWPPREVNGFLVSGLLTPSTGSVFTHPPELGSELLEAVPDYHIFNLETAVEEANRESLEAFLDFAAATVATRAEAACWLVRRQPVELLMVHFQATDIVQHVLWHYLDPGHERFDPAKNRLIFERFYGALDRAVGRVLDTFAAQRSDSPVTFVISDHGFQRHAKRFNLWLWLVQQGWLIPGLAGAAALSDTVAGGIVTGTTAAFPESDPPVASSSTWSQAPVDLATSRALSTGRSNEAFIWLLVDDPVERDRIADTIVTDLEAVRDPLDGEPLVERVCRREDIWSGPRLEECPDLVVVPAGPVSITGRFDPGTDLVIPVEPGHDFHAGRHHPDGIIIVSGPGILPTPVPAHTVGGAGTDGPVATPDSVPFTDLKTRLVDVAPAVLALLGIEEEGPGRGEDAANTAEDAAHTPGDAVYTPEEKAIIEKRLRDLGYF